MAVQFILGRSGTGKTSYCIKAIVDSLLKMADNEPLILLVPEQATYQAERAILSDRKVAGYNRLRVLSFARLQFLLSGKNTAKPAVSRIGQQMIIQRILRENKNKLKVFGSSATFPGLGRQIAQTMDELHQYAQTPEDIEQLLGRLQKDNHDTLTALKFADIQLIFREYLNFIESDFLNPDIQLKQSCQQVAESPFTKGAKLWVDGFAGFTASELMILTELMKSAADTKIALCLDPSSIDLANPDKAEFESTSIFSPTEQTYAELVRTVKENKLQMAKPVILKVPIRFSTGPELAHIESNIFKLKSSKMPAGDSVRIISAPNIRAEVRFVAREILQLLKEKDYRYRDIAVIASDIELYEHYIRACFDDYGIPFFIDRPKKLNQHPAIALICSALQVVLEGFSHSDIFSFLKTDLVPIERNDVDLLENYCLAFGITGSNWIDKQDWKFAGKDDKQFDEKRINNIRLKVISPLLELRDKLCPVENPAKTMKADEFVRIIFDFLNGLGVPETIGNRVEQGQEHQQFYKALLDILDELTEVFIGRQETAENYYAIINSAFSQMTLAFIPPTLDQILVGSIERSRHPDLKAVFLIGATQKVFPVPVTFDSILTDEDRKAAEEAEFELAAATSQKLAERQYLAYIAFTRPKELLRVTYSSTDEGGGTATPSQFIDNLQSLFENLTEQSAAEYGNEIERIHSKSDLTDLLCTRLGKDIFETEKKDPLDELLSNIASDDELAELGLDVQSAINYDNSAELDKDVVKKLFGRQLKSSATRLGTFAACPYQYFARYILELEERKEFKLRPLEVGDFYHRVLDALLKKLSDLHEDFAAIKKDELLKLLQRQMSEVVQANSFMSNFSHRSRHNVYIIQSAGEYLEDCVLAIAEMVRAGSFRPKWSEVSFGDVKDSAVNIGKYEIKLSDGRVITLNGKIDRLDAANIDGQNVAVIFDYKRSRYSAVFSWSKFYYGLNMQLPIYILAANKADNSEIDAAIGAFFIPVEATPKAATFTELSKKAAKFQHNANGLFNGQFFRHLDSTNSNKFYNFFVKQDGNQYGYENRSGAVKPDDFEKIMKFTLNKSIGFIQKILSGKIDVYPYRLGSERACTYCEYKSLCRFDWQINDYNFLEPLGKLEVLEKINDNNGG